MLGTLVKSASITPLMFRGIALGAAFGGAPGALRAPGAPAWSEGVSGKIRLWGHVGALLLYFPFKRGDGGSGTASPTSKVHSTGRPFSQAPNSTIFRHHAARERASSEINTSARKITEFCNPCKNILGGPRGSSRRHGGSRNAKTGPRPGKSASRTGQDCSKTVQEAPKTAQEAPTTAQEAPKTGQEAFQCEVWNPSQAFFWGGAPDGPKTVQEAPKITPKAPSTAQEAPKTAQEAPQSDFWNPFHTFFGPPCAAGAPGNLVWAIP